ncbi:hypothetical protein G6F37_013189 [Rhizopus arrhizus]|nr:hypothetical protein G6F38_012403 [Rhizopus arrhizus]KAG1139239.1 hypothetical protein G6F37_013189 [Rhizopus arrhizus]
MGQFRRNGPTKTDPPMPIFRCHECGKTFKARTMINANDQAQDMQPLLDMIQRLSAELVAARAEIGNLRQQVIQLQGQTTLQPSHSKDDNQFNSKDFPPLSSQTPPWHNPQPTPITTTRSSRTPPTAPI